MNPYTIYHNSRCSNSRGALAILQDAGIAPEVIDYLANPPDEATLRRLLSDAGLSPRAAIRSKEADYTRLGLQDPARTDDELIRAMVAHPRLINRPFVVTPKGTRLCRPPEQVRELLP